jgi:hypothetical protein
MADGFSVDLPALESASAGINMTLEELSVAKIDTLDGDRAAYGDDGLAGAVVDFCDRWEIGVEHLAVDGQEVADRLNQCVKAYRQVDAAAHDRLHGVVQRGSGPDPAAD